MGRWLDGGQVGEWVVGGLSVVGGFVIRRSGEHIGVSPLTGKKSKPVNNSAPCDHLIHCNYFPSSANFSILARENKKFLLEVKESPLLMRDTSSLNRKVSSAPLHLFDKAS